MTQAAATDAALDSFLRSMPKAELHIHLEGAIQAETLLELARKHGRLDRLPGEDVATLREWFTFTDFPHFIRIYVTISDLLRDADDFSTVTYALGADMAAQGIRYREVTFTPTTHLLLHPKGITIDDILDGLEDGRQRARRDFGVEIRWVFDIARDAAFRGGTYSPMLADATLEYAIKGMDRGVIGFGLGGFEVNAPPEPFAHAFARAKAAGLLSLPHAGETMGPGSVWGALDALGADRIGHSVRGIEDAKLLARLVEKQTPLELNPTSNFRLHIYRRLAEHPFPHLDRMGIFCTVNSDDPPLFNTSLLQEYRVLADEFGYDRANLARIARNAFLASGAEESLKRDLLAQFDAWRLAITA